MSFLEVMHTYFRGEKVEAFAFILPVGLVVVTAAALALKWERSPFTWGAAVPVILFGLLYVVVGASVGVRTNAQVAELERGYAESPATMVAKELPRMEKVNANFHTTKIVFGVLIAVGLIGFFVLPMESAKGIGVGVILVCALGLAIDGIASRRALPYTTALEAIAAEHAPPVASE